MYKSAHSVADYKIINLYVLNINNHINILILVYQYVS